MWFVGLNFLLIVILLIHAFGERKLSKRMLHGMWAVIPVFLLTCNFISFRSPVVLKPFFEKEEPSYTAQITKEEKTVEADAETVPIYSKDITAASGGGRYDIKTVFKIVWVLGSMMSLAVILFSNIRFYGRLKSERVYFRKDEESGLDIYLYGGKISPFLLWNKIYIHPDIARDSKTADYAIRHEVCHYRHGDMVWSLFKFAIVSALWFDPIVWYASTVFENDCELYCDDRVISGLSEEKRNEYGQMLLAVFAKGRKERALFSLSASLKGNKGNLMRKRITEIKRRSKKSLVSAVVVTGILVGAVGCSLVDPTAEPKSGIKESIFETTAAAEIEQTVQERSDRTKIEKMAVSPLSDPADPVQKFFDDNHYEIKGEDWDYLIYDDHYNLIDDEIDLGNPDNPEADTLDYLTFDIDRLDDGLKELALDLQASGYTLRDLHLVRDSGSGLSAMNVTFINGFAAGNSAPGYETDIIYGVRVTEDIFSSVMKPALTSEGSSIIRGLSDYRVDDSGVWTDNGEEITYSWSSDQFEVSLKYDRQTGVMIFRQTSLGSDEPVG